MDCYSKKDCSLKQDKIMKLEKEIEGLKKECYNADRINLAWILLPLWKRIYLYFRRDKTTDILKKQLEEHDEFYLRNKRSIDAGTVKLLKRALSDDNLDEQTKQKIQVEIDKRSY